MHLSRGPKVFRVFNYVFLAMLGLLMVYPFWYVIQASVSDPIFKDSNLWPKGFYYRNYLVVLTGGPMKLGTGLGRAYMISILRVVVTVPLMLMVTGCAAFALTRRELKGRKIIIFYYFITMFVSGGLIPFYMVLKTVGILNTFWVFVFPVLFSVWTMIVMKTSFQGLPEGLVEAGLIDGASYGRIFFRIILPLSLPMIATLGLFQAVWHWNDWFYGAFYVRDQNLRPLQTFVRQVVTGTSSLADKLEEQIRQQSTMHPDRFADDPQKLGEYQRLSARSIKMAYLVLTTFPILLLYPFLQKYFIKGVLIGSIKG